MQEKEINIPLETKDPLGEYIKKYLKEGFSEEKIKKTLLKVGWQEDEVKKGFENLKLKK